MRALCPCRIGALLPLALPTLLGAQGITTAAISGTITRPDGSPAAEAAVTVTHEGNGRRWEIVTGSSGRFLLEGVAVGGPYRIEARAIGFAPAARIGVLLTLGQRLAVDLALGEAALELPDLVVSAVRDPALDPGRTGPAEIVGATTIARLPNPRRDFLHLTLLSPQAAPSPSSVFSRSGGVAVGGQSTTCTAAACRDGRRCPGRSHWRRSRRSRCTPRPSTCATPDSPAGW